MGSAPDRPLMLCFPFGLLSKSEATGSSPLNIVVLPDMSGRQPCRKQASMASMGSEWPDCFFQGGRGGLAFASRGAQRHSIASRRFMCRDSRNSRKKDNLRLHQHLIARLDIHNINLRMVLLVDFP